MATTTRSGVKKKKAPPGFRWKTVTKMNAIGRPYTTHVLVPIESAKVPPETIFTAEESIRGAEDRQASMPDMLPGGTQRLKEDVTTVIKEYEGDTPNTKTTTIKGGLLGDMYDKFDPYGGIGTGGGMDDPNWSRATAINTPRPTNLPGTDFFGGGVTAPQTKEEPFRPPAWASTLTDPNQLPAEAAGRNRPRGSFSSLQMVPGAPPPNPYRDNVGPMYSGQKYPGRSQSLLGQDEDSPFGRGPHVGWGADGQAIYMNDLISVGPGGGVGKTAETTVKFLPRMRDAVKAFFTKKGKPAPKPKPKTKEDGTDGPGVIKNPDTGKPFTTAELAALEASKATTAIPKDPSRIRRVSRASAKAVPALTADALVLGAAGYVADNALVHDVVDKVVKTTGLLATEVTEVFGHITDAAKRVGETRKARAKRQMGESITAKGLLELPDKDARAGTEFFGQGDVAGDTLTPEKGKVPTPATPVDPLKKFWGKYADDPAKRKQKYLDSLSSIWRKAAIMDAIAAATGGESRSPQFMAMMSQRMDAIAKFDDEERLHNIFKAVYYNPETGVYNAPKDKTDAYERAIKLGASPAEAKKIFGYQPEPDNQLVEWYYKDPVTNEYVTEHVRGKDTMPEGDYNWSKGKTPIMTETEEIGGTKNERAWNEIKATLGRGGLEGNLDDAIRIYMQYDKVDPIMGFDVKEARTRAEQHIMSTMTGHERKAYTYTPTEGEELSEERLAELRKLGYAYVIVDGKEEALVWRA